MTRKATNRTFLYGKYHKSRLLFLEPCSETGTGHYSNFGHVVQDATNLIIVSVISNYAVFKC